MILRMSSLFVRTLREDPADAEVPSHRLLVRAGYIRRAAPGIYSWLPLGLRVLRNIERIVREEMDAMGAQELQFPALLPREPYEATGRWSEYGDGIFRLKDRKGGDYLLGPTHEELFTLVVKDLYSSYKDLPVWLYQIQTKYRDEARPRAGLLRGREFVMKDSYSFDVSDEGLDRSYEAHRAAYVKIFDRLGFDYVIVKATSGAMGGSKSEEFLATAENGEDTYVRCSSCDYAANVEAVQVRPPQPVTYDDAPAAHAEQTPETPTIETLVDHLNERFPRADRPWHAGDTLKNVLVMLKHPDGSREPIAIGLPGDREVDAKRLSGQLEPTEVEAFDEADFAKHPALAKGYIGPGVLGEKNESGIRYLVDPRVAEGTRWVTGADVAGSHVLDLVADRDFSPDGTIEAADVRDGDPLPTVPFSWERRRPAHCARHRDGPHLRTRPQVRRRPRPAGARRARQAGHGDDGVLRRRRVTGSRRDRGEHPRRARSGVAARGRPGRRTPRRHRQGRRLVRGGGAARGRAGIPGAERAVRRPPEGLAGREVQGCRAHRHPDHRRGRTRARRRGRRGQGPGFGGARGRRRRRAGGARRPDRAAAGRHGGPRALMAPVRAVIFDWGGTLTPWHAVDFEKESRVLAVAAVEAGEDAHERLGRAVQRVWGRSRDDHTSATVADIFAEAGLRHDASLLAGYRDFWASHSLTDPDVLPLFGRLRADGIKVGVLSNTVWPREWHEEFFRRDGVLDLVDGAVYTSEIPWTKPAPEAFHAAMESVRVEDPAACVFVGDRLFDDIWGASNVGMRTVHVPHSDIPRNQVGHSEGQPDEVAERLAHVYDVVSAWRTTG